MAMYKWTKPLQRHLQPQRLESKLPFGAYVERVCDGDTIAVAEWCDGELLPEIEFVRLAAIDAPELRGADQAAALASRAALTTLICHQTVTIWPTRIWRDPYYRIIARVTLSGLDVGAWLVERGFAKPRLCNKAATKLIPRQCHTPSAPGTPPKLSPGSYPAPSPE